MTSLKLHAAIVASFLALAPVSASAEIVGKVGVDWTGNDILVDAVPDPEVSGVTCFEKGRRC
jgi:CreA protein